MTNPRIISVTPCSSERVDIEGGEWSTYFRYAYNSWGVVMGMSLEPILWDEETAKLEDLYQEWRKDHAGIV